MSERLFFHGPEVSSLPGRLIDRDSVLYWCPEYHIDIGVVPELRPLWYSYLKGLSIRNHVSLSGLEPYVPRRVKHLGSTSESNLVKLFRSYGVSITPRMQECIVRLGGKPPRYTVPSLQRRVYLKEWYTDFCENPGAYSLRMSSFPTKWLDKKMCADFIAAESLYRACRFALLRVKRASKKTLCYLRKRIIVNYNKVRDEWSELCDYCRISPFRHDFPSPKLIWVVKGLNSKQLLDFSYSKRAIPATPKGDPPIDRWIENLTRPARPIKGPFRQWVRSWISRFRGEKPRGGTLYPSTAAGLERTRREGGQKSFYVDIINYQKARFMCRNIPHMRSPYDVYFWENYSSIRAQFSPENFFDFYDIKEFGEAQINVLLLVCGSLNLLRDQIEHSKLCSGCPVDGKHPSCYPLSVKEKGAKWRIPTISSTSLVILSGLLRSLIDPYLESDPRIRIPLKGQIGSSVEKMRGPFRSLDLTSASDLQHFDIARETYLGILDDLELPFWYRDIVYVCTGSMHLWTSNGAPTGGHPPFDTSTTDLVPNPYWQLFLSKPQLYLSSGFVVNPKDSRGSLARIGFDEVKIELTDLNCIRERIIAFEGGNLRHEAHVFEGFTLRGQLMGLSSTWPTLPLVSLYAFEMAKRGFSAEALCFGDDALFGNISSKENDAITHHLTDLGSESSAKKDFYHDHLALFTEILFEDGKKLGILPHSPFTCPAGAVRENNWATCPQAGRELLTLHGASHNSLKRSLMHSAFIEEWAYASGIGLPLHLKSSRAGLGLPLHFRGSKEWRKKMDYPKDLYRELLHPSLPLITPAPSLSRARMKAKKDFLRAGIMTRLPGSKKGVKELKTSPEGGAASLDELIEIRAGLYMARDVFNVPPTPYEGRPKIISTAIQLYKRRRELKVEKQSPEAFDCSELFTFYSLLFKEKCRGNPLYVPTTEGDMSRLAFSYSTKWWERGIINIVEYDDEESYMGLSNYASALDGTCWSIKEQDYWSKDGAGVDRVNLHGDAPN